MKPRLATMMTRAFLFLAMVFVAGKAFAADNPYFLEATATPADGLVPCDGVFAITYRLLKDGHPAPHERLRYTLQWERDTIRQETVETTTEAVRLEYSSDKPGWMYLFFQILGEDGKPIEAPGKQCVQGKKGVLYEIGAIFGAEKIIAKPSCPADFDEFWTTERKRLKALPMEVVLTPLQNAPSGNKVNTYAAAINCLGRKSVTGYLSLPKDAKQGSLPIIIDFQSMTWRDASPSTSASSAALYHAIAFVCSWHGLETGHNPAWYDNQGKTYLNNWGLNDISSKTKWFYHDMYLRVLRLLDYMKTRPEWNGRDLIVRGGSMGGIQSIVAAALEPAVSLAVIDVPAGCEFNAAASGRRQPWVMCGSNPKLLENKDVAEALAYHDAVNFAPRFHCPTFICTGFVDEICYPSGIYAFYNALPADIHKVLSTNPLTGHGFTTPNTAGHAFLKRYQVK